MDNNAGAILSSINQSIVIDEVNLVRPIIVNQLEKLPDWADVGRQIFLTAVTYHSYKITNFMFHRHLGLLWGDSSYKIWIMQHAISCCNVYVIELFLTFDVAFSRDITPYSYDILIDYAHQTLEGLRRLSGPNNQQENIIRLNRILKLLLEYPHNRYNQLGIILEYDEDTFGYIVSSNDSLDINRLSIYNYTVLETWIHYEKESTSYVFGISLYIRTIFSDIIIYLIKHIVIKQTLGLILSKNNVQAINSEIGYQQLHAACINEIRRMKNTVVDSDRSISVFDILNARKDTLAQYTENDTIWDYVFSGSPIQLFPIYGKDIVNSFIRSINEQRRLLDQCF